MAFGLSVMPLSPGQLTLAVAAASAVAIALSLAVGLAVWANVGADPGTSLGAWSPWGACSATCRNGTAERSRVVANQDCREQTSSDDAKLI